MRNLHSPTIDRYRDRSQRVREHYGGIGDDKCGVFNVPSPVNGHAMHVIASSDFGWDHVSVSLATRCPTWDELEHVKRLFFSDDECAMQLHVPVADHVNAHPFCLHLWRPNDGRELPRPPNLLV